MSLIALVLILILFGVLLYLFNAYVTAIDARVKQIVNVVVIIVLILFVLYAFGVWDEIKSVKVPKL